MQIQLTKKEAELIEWALDPMVDYWTDESGARERGDVETDENGPIYAQDQLPKLDGTVLTLSPIDDINTDLHYRIAEQLDKMTDEADELTPQARSGQHRLIDSIVDKLEKAGVKPTVREPFEWEEGKNPYDAIH